MGLDSDDNEDFFVQIVNKLQSNLDNVLAGIYVLFCCFYSAI